MRQTQVSTTAQGIALARALEYTRPPEQRVCNDPLARRLMSTPFYLFGRLFASYGERKGPGVIGFLVARCRYIDDYLLECLAAGIQQLVILGAGLDSRAYRIEQLKQGVRVFEVDQAVTQQAKLAKLKRILGQLPSYVTFVAIDFNSEDLQKLFEHGYTRQAKTLFIWEGVVHYLTAQAVDQTLEFVHRNSAPGSSIAFDYIYSSALTEAHKRGEVVRMQRASRYTGEALAFGIEEGQAEQFLQARGYTGIKNVSSADLKRAYFTGANQTRAVAPVYAIVHASVPA